MSVRYLQFRFLLSVVKFARFTSFVTAREPWLVYHFSYQAPAELSGLDSEPSEHYTLSTDPPVEYFPSM